MLLYYFKHYEKEKQMNNQVLEKHKHAAIYVRVSTTMQTKGDSLGSQTERLIARCESDGFKKYDDELYFHDHGVIGDKRFIVGFNPTLFAEDRKNRKEKIRFFETYLKNENKDLKNAQRDRKLKATEGRVLNELKRLKIKKYYEEPTLHPIVVQKRLKNGIVKSVNSFRIQVKKKADIIVADKLLDGVCVFITNHIERQGRGFKVNPRKIIHAYRDKTKIEDVFKNPFVLEHMVIL